MPSAYEETDIIAYCGNDIALTLYEILHYNTNRKIKISYPNEKKQLNERNRKMNETQIRRLLPQGTSEKTIKKALDKFMFYSINGLEILEVFPRCCAADPDPYTNVVYIATDENDLKRWFSEHI